MTKRNRIEIDYDRIYQSKFDGQYKILKEIESDDKKHRKVLIQFLETRNIQEAKLDKADKGSVSDRLKHTPDFNKVYQSNTSGSYKILEILDERICGKIIVKIMFLETGTIRDVRLQDALIGKVRDPYRISVCGFGITGENNTTTREYATWNSMINRCYNPNYDSYINYGNKGVTVCERWRYFDNFKIDITYLPGYDLWLNNPGDYALDKDVLQMGIPEYQKIYSPETCCFISIFENAKYAGLYQNMHKDSITSKHMGVFKKANGGFEVNITMSGNSYNPGVFYTEEAAANLYNNITKFYYGDSINPAFLNNVPYMAPEEIIRQRTTIKEMCKIIHKEKIIYKSKVQRLSP